MDFLSTYGLFLLETFTLVIAFLLAVSGFFAISKKEKPTIQIIDLNKNYENIRHLINEEIGNKIKKDKKDKKKTESKPKLYVLEFDGDIKASQVEQLRKEITAVIAIAQPEDEVLLRLESPGGAANAYGLAASQLERLRRANIPLTVCIDRVAASGGYLMACVANHIVAAPFAILGSIGVVAQIPNFHRWLEKNDIDVELITSGEYKRTLTVLGKNTEKGREKFKEDLEKIHQAFSNEVLSHREQISIHEVATGEFWLAKDAMNLKLIDALGTSDEILIKKMETFHAFKIKMPMKVPLLNKLIKPAMKLLQVW